MNDLGEFGDLVRKELGSPPREWSAEQRRRLKGVALAGPPRRSRAAKLAGGVVLAAACIGAVLWLRSPEPPNEGAQHVPALADPAPQAAPQTVWLAAEGKPETFPLADESTIELRPGARGRLDQHPGAETRFDLHGGTATFEVRPQEQPFFVVAGQYRIEVIGTRFLVTYGPADHLVVAVEVGAVGVHLPGRSERVRLEAGDRLETEGGELTLRSATAGEDDPESARQASPAPAVGEASASWQSLYRQGKISEACTRVKERRPSHWRQSLSADELLELSAALRPCGDDEGALSMLEAVRTRFPASTQARDALFLRGRIEAGRGRSADAISSFEAYVEQAPSARFATEALGRLIELHASRGDGARARELARRYLQRAPNGPYRALAEDVLTRGHP